jgi:putative transcriptional regulator
MASRGPSVRELCERSGAAVLAALAIGIAAGAAGATSASARLKPGILLYAVPRLQDPNFAESVVLLVQHGRDGSLGLIINKPTEMRATQVLGRNAPRDLFVFRGGPVQREAVLALVRTLRPIGESMRVFDDVYLVGQRADLDEATRAYGSERVRIYSGYSGWSPGQLENELKLGGWVTARAEAKAIFSDEPELLWRKVFQLLERREAD